MLELAGGSMIRGSARFLFGLAHGSVICALQNLRWLHLPKMENGKLVPTILYLEYLYLPFIPFSHFPIHHSLFNFLPAYTVLDAPPLRLSQPPFTAQPPFFISQPCFFTSPRPPSTSQRCFFTSPHPPFTSQPCFFTFARCFSIAPPPFFTFQRPRVSFPPPHVSSPRPHVTLPPPRVSSQRSFSIGICSYSQIDLLFLFH